MPACDISASIAIRAPVTGLAAASANLKVIVSAPTRGGSGEISCSIATEVGGSTGLEQPAISKIAAQLTRYRTEKRQNTFRSGSFCRLVAAPLAGAVSATVVTLWREHVIVHADHHGYEHDRVVKKMEFDPREDKLQHAAGYRLTPKIMVKRGLPDKQEMFDVMPELNPEGYHPPGMRPPGKTLAQHPNADEHDQGIAVVQRFCLDQPWI